LGFYSRAAGGRIRLKRESYLFFAVVFYGGE
jgi:hypothetical protein